MKRLLKKKALMNPEMFEGTLKQLGNKGRTILKGIEDYKFSLEQAARIVANDQELSQKIIQKKKSLDQAAGQIYSIVFEIENIDITNAFQQQQMVVNNPGMNNKPEGEPVPNTPIAPQNSGAPMAPNNSDAPIPSGGGMGIPSEAPSTPDKSEESTEEETEPKVEENEDNNSEQVEEE